jgi:ASC-1-like (ASCH) protein
MKLATEYFQKIKNGTKTIECRLNDEKRKSLRIGDKIEFSDVQNDADKTTAEIVALHIFPAFSELLNCFPITSFGADNKKDFLAVLKKIYSDKDEKKYGVVGIEVKLFINKMGAQA